MTTFGTKSPKFKIKDVAIFSGNGMPLSTDGNDGDLYIRLDTADLYIKHPVVGWHMTAGATVGPIGFTGSKGYTGSKGDGFNVQGVMNDVADLPYPGNFVGEAYIINGEIYIWNGSLWVLAGDSAPRGFTGSRGFVGQTGYVGSMGYTGSRGADGTSVTILGTLNDESELPPSGNPGDSWIIDGDLYVWSASTNDWVNVGSIQGPQGIQGVIGYTGSQGVIGYTGSQGYTGSRGSQGIQGFTGSFGFTGSQGDQGIQGIQGYTGSFGFTGSFGLTGYTGSQGIGFTGSQGYTGSQGIQGNLGYTGSVGLQGVIGFTGSQGVTGFVGSKGDQGVTGFVGSRGFTGSFGLTGFTGSFGFTGSQGDLGSLGFTGSRGYTGSQGNQGITGFTGSQGVIGFTGSRGIDGVIGHDGKDFNYSDVSAQVGYAVTNSIAAALTTPGTANRRYLLKSIHVTNIGAAAGWVTSELQITGGNFELINQIPLPTGTSIELLKKPKVLYPSNSVRMQADANSKFHATISYMIYENEDFVHGGVDLTSINMTDVFVAANANGIVIDSILVAADSANNEKITIVWTNGSNTIQGYIANGLIIPQNASVELLEGPKFLANGFKIRAQAGAANRLEVLVSGYKRV